jgi:hypothetical protein
LRLPDDPELNMIPVRVAEQLLSELVPSTPILVRVTFVALIKICAYAPENVLFGIVTTAAPVLPAVLVTPFHVSGVAIVTCSA